MYINVYIIILAICMALYIVALSINIIHIEEIIDLMFNNIKYIIEIDKHIYNKVLLDTKIIIILGVSLVILSILLSLVPVIPIWYYMFLIRKLKCFNEIYEDILKNYNNM